MALSTTSTRVLDLQEQLKEAKNAQAEEAAAATSQGLGSGKGKKKGLGKVKAKGKGSGEGNMIGGLLRGSLSSLSNMLRMHICQSKATLQKQMHTNSANCISDRTH